MFPLLIMAATMGLMERSRWRPGVADVYKRQGLVTRLGREVEEATTPTGEATPPTSSVERTSSSVESGPSIPSGAYLTVATLVMHLLVQSGMVIIFLFFVIVYRTDLRDRFIGLAGMGAVHRTTAIMNEAAGRVSRFMVSTLLVNVTFGVIFGVALFLIGLPSAVLWGTIAAAMRFIPFIGAPISALGPIALSLAIEADWSAPLLVLGTFIIIEVILSHLVEPWLYGESVGVSPLALIVASLFWATLWGPIGLLLATPLLVCLVVLGRHVPHLEFLHLLCGNEPPLAIEISIYQRLLANDRDGATALLEQAAEGRPLPKLCDTIVLEILRMIDMDFKRGALSSTDKAKMLEGLEELLESLDAGETSPETLAASAPIACIGARTTIDDTAAAILCTLLRNTGRRAVQLTRTWAARPESEPLSTVETVVLVAAGPQANRAIRRWLGPIARHMSAGVRVLVLTLDVDGRSVLDPTSLGEPGPVSVDTSLQNALATVRGLDAASPETGGSRVAPTQGIAAPTESIVAP